MKLLNICIAMVLVGCSMPTASPNFDDDYMHPNEGEGERITYRKYNTVLNVESDTLCTVKLPFDTTTYVVDGNIEYKGSTACNYKRDGVIKGFFVNDVETPVFILDTIQADTIQTGDIRTITYDIICDTIFIK